MSGVAALKKVHHNHQNEEPVNKEKLNKVLKEINNAEQVIEVGYEIGKRVSPFFTLLQPREDQQKNVLKENGYIWVSGRDYGGGKHEGFLQKPEGLSSKDYLAQVKSFKAWFPPPKPTTFLAQDATPKAPADVSKNPARIGGTIGRNLAAELNPSKEDIKPALFPQNAKASTAAAGKDLKDQEFLAALEIQTAPRPAVAEKTPPRARMSEGTFLEESSPLRLPTEISLEVEGKHVILPFGEASGSFRTYMPARVSDYNFFIPGSELPPKDMLLVKGNLVKRGDLESYVKSNFSASESKAILRTIEASQPK